jgi:hypothetical protein
MPDIIGAPIKSVQKAFDCWTQMRSLELPLIYERLVVGLFYPIIILVEIILIYSIVNIL